VAVATVTATRLAQHAAGNDLAGMRGTFERGMRLVAFLTVPSTLGLILLREPIVRLLFEHGRFEPSSTPHVALALALYALGLYAYSGVKVAAPAFYALDRTRVPVLASISAVAANLIMSVALFPSMGYRGLALGLSVAAIVNFIVLLIAFQRLAGALELRSLAGHALRVGLATVPCGLAAWGTAGLVEAWLGHASLAPRLLAVIAPVTLAVITYALGCRLLRLEELDVVTVLVRRRSRAKPTGPRE
jgi:putative peptidoglycan lipid II flippase